VASGRHFAIGFGKSAFRRAGGAGEHCHVNCSKGRRDVHASFSFELPAGDGIDGLCALSWKDVLAGKLQRALSVSGSLADGRIDMCRRVGFGDFRCCLRFASAATVFAGRMVLVFGNAGASDWPHTLGIAIHEQPLHLHADDRDIAVFGLGG